MLYKFADTASPRMSVEQRSEFAHGLRHGIEVVLSLGDNLALASERQEALLSQTNGL
ncbi:hypothetical protein [Paraburkholderia sp. JHI869]|uniref:hypothetical protein n=1 Tax=Paraburkholderia sp. JHI869 TaxID=3112959 RepID=UPI0031736294